MSMKNILRYPYKSLLKLFLVATLSLSSCFSYSYVSIISLEIFPENPTTEDEVFLITHIYATSMYNYPGSIVQSSNNEINVSVCFYIGGYNPAQPTDYYDTISLGFIGAGDYTLSYTVSTTLNLSAGCNAGDATDRQDILFFVDQFLSLDNFESSSLTVFPNPTHLNTKITWDNEITAESISFYSLSGRKVKTIICNTGSNEEVIDLSDLENGIYIMELTSTNGIYNRKIIKH